MEAEQVVEQEAQEDIQEEVSHETPSVEALASDMGWVPKDDYRGDPDRWVSADVFIKNTLGIQKTYQRKVESLEGKLDQLVSQQSHTMMQALKEQKARLQKEFEEAVEAGDKAAAKRATEGLNDLERQAPDTEQQRMIAQWKPHADAFAQRNSGALQDKLAQIEATKMITSMAEAGVSPEETYERVEIELRKKYPEHYQNQNRTRPAKVEGESRPASSDKSKWSALVKEYPEAEKIFAKFVNQGVYKDTKEQRERYAKAALEG